MLREEVIMLIRRESPEIDIEYAKAFSQTRTINWLNFFYSRN